MSQETLSVYQKALRYFHGPRMANAIPDKVYFLRTAEDRSNTIKWGGRDAQMQFPVHHKRAWGTGAHTEGGDTGTPRQHGFAEYTVGIAGLNLNFELSDRLIKATRNRPELSYVGSALEFEMNWLMQTARKLLGILVHGDGTGALARVDTDAGAITATQFYVDTPGIQWLEEGMFLEAHTNKSGAEANQFTAGAQEVSALDVVNGRVTVSDTTGLANNDWLFLYGHYNVAAPNGIMGCVDDGTIQSTFQNVTRSGNPFSQAHMVTLTDAPLNEQNVFRTFRRLHQFAPADQVADHIFTDPESLEWLALSVLDRQRFDGTDIKAGFGTVKYQTPWGTKTLVSDPLAYPYRMQFLRMADFFYGWLTRKGGEWFNEDGQMLEKKTSSTAGTGYALAYVATWLMELQFGCENPRNQARLEGYIAS